MREGSEATRLISRDGVRSFFEQFGLHLVMEVTVVSIIDRAVMNTALSMVIGVGLVEGTRVLWRRWRKTS